MTRQNLITLVALLSMTLGCEVPELESVDTTAASPAPQAATVEKEPVKEEETVAANDPPVTSEPREVTANDPTKGKKSRQAGGYLGAVGHARFYAEHQLIFTSIKHALNLYWATNGEYPKTHDEFMEKVIKFNQIQLPKLDEGVEYLYDPEDHKLKIHSPGAEAEADDSSDPSDRS